MTHRGVAKREFINLPLKIDNETYDVTFKLGYLGEEIISNRPEYEDIKQISQKTGLPLNKIMDKATSTIIEHLKKK